MAAPQTSVRRLVTTVLTVACAVGMTGTAAQISPLPGGRPKNVAVRPDSLSTSDWSAIRDEHLRRRQAPLPVRGGWRAVNDRQQWSMLFDGHGFEVTPHSGSWRWGLRLTAYGYRGQERRADKPTSAGDANTFTYQWDATLREWYINAGGLEHGYTLSTRPGSGSHLQFHLAVRGTLQPVVAADARSVGFVDAASRRTVISYHGLNVIDAAGRMLDARFEREPAGLRLTVDDSGARYPITVDPVAEEAHLAASNPDQADRFGTAVAVQDRFAVIGAYNESSAGSNGNCTPDNNKPQAGAAYVFYHMRSTGAWVEMACLKASNADARDFFGYSVSIGRDAVGNRRLAVGSWGEDGPRDPTGNASPDTFNLGVDSGAAYVFKLQPAVCFDISTPALEDLCVLGGTWSQEQYLKGPYLQPGDHFSIVAMSGSTLVVGAFGDDLDGTGGSAPDEGAAYVYTLNTATGRWTNQAYLKPPCFCVSHTFGNSVAISDDEQTIAVGAWRDAVGWQSRAYVFTRTATGWSAPVTLQRPNTTANTKFGWSVSVSGDTVAVGAPDSTFGTGAAYLYTRSSGVWSAPTSLTFTPPVNVCTNATAQFGFAVALSGDNLIVGATGVNNACGTAYVYNRSGAAWSPQDPIQASNSSADQYGFSVAVDGGTFLVGAPTGESMGIRGAGAAYILGLPVSLVSIQISAPKSQLYLLESELFTAIGTFSDGSTSDISNRVTWNSSTPSMVFFSPGVGYGTGVALGAADITATLDGKTSNALTVTVVDKLSQTIAFSPLPDKVLGDPPFTVSATASSGLTVSFTASGSCQIAGTTVTLLNVGVCTITASNAGSVSYAPAVPISTSFTVGGRTTAAFTGIAPGARITIPHGQAVSLTVQVTSAIGVVPDGDVILTDFMVPLPIAPQTLVNGSTVFLVPNLGIGVHSIAATYQGSANQYLLASAPSSAVQVQVNGAFGVDESSGTAARTILIGVDAGNPITPLDRLYGTFGAESSRSSYVPNVGDSHAEGVLFATGDSGLGVVQPSTGPQVGAYGWTSGVAGCVSNCTQGTGAARAIAYATYRNDTLTAQIGQTANGVLEGLFNGNPGQVTAAMYVFDAGMFLDRIDTSGESMPQFLLGHDALSDYAAGAEASLSLTRLFPGAALKAKSPFEVVNGAIPNVLLPVRTQAFDVQPGDTVIVVVDMSIYQPPGGTTSFANTFKPASVFLTDAAGQPSALTPVGPWTPQPAAVANLTLTPASASNPLKTPVTLTATATTATGAAVPNAQVFLQIASGPNAQPIGPQLTDANGQVAFTYDGGSSAGTDIVRATIGTLQSNDAVITWTSADPLDHISVTPATATISAGSTQSYTVHAFDESNHDLGDVTATATLTIAPDGSCTGATCTATIAGTHTVTAAYNGRSATATLTVVASTQSRTADLAIAMSGPTTAARGTVASYTVVVTNRGPDAADNATVVLIAGPGAVLTSSAPAPSVSGAAAAAWCVPRLESGQAVTFTVKYKLTREGPVVLLGTAVSDTRDPKLTNNFVLMSTRVK